MKPRLSIFIFVLVVAVAAARVPPRAEAPYAGKPAVIAATFSSAWCPACMILKPRIAGVIPKFAGEPVKFVDYDLTFGDLAELRAAAAADGLEAIYERHAKAAGYTLLIDADTGDIIDILTISRSSDAMRAAIAKAIGLAEAKSSVQG